MLTQMTNFQVHNGASFTLPWFYCINHLGWAGNSVAQIFYDIYSQFLSISGTYTLHCRVHTLHQLPSVMQEKIICLRVQLQVASMGSFGECSLAHRYSCPRALLIETCSQIFQYLFFIPKTELSISLDMSPLQYNSF